MPVIPAVKTPMKNASSISSKLKNKPVINISSTSPKPKAPLIIEDTINIKPDITNIDSNKLTISIPFITLYIKQKMPKAMTVEV